MRMFVIDCLSDNYLNNFYDSNYNQYDNTNHNNYNLDFDDHL